jgi:hypothetical protein
MFEHCGHGFIVIDAFDSSSCKLSPAFTSGHVLLQHSDIQDRDGRSSRRWGWCSWLNLAEFSSVFPFNAPLLHWMSLVSCEFLVSSAISGAPMRGLLKELAPARQLL